VNKNEQKQWKQLVYNFNAKQKPKNDAVNVANKNKQLPKP
jgi:hypothetical protein